jgi:hypothetical protein
MTKAHNRVHIFVYQFKSVHENVAQFRTKSFVIAVSDPKVLEVTFGCELKDIKGHEGASVIVTRPNGHMEFWTHPLYKEHRKAHLAGFKDAGIYRPEGYDDNFNSDHAYTRSAAKSAAKSDAEFQPVLVKMNYIPKWENSSWGASVVEKGFTHRRLDNKGYCSGNLFDLYKSVGGRLANATDPVGSLRAAVPDLENRGLISASERNLFNQAAKEATDYRQDQDTAYAVATGQVNLDPDKPMIPGS